MKDYTPKNIVEPLASHVAKGTNEYYPLDLVQQLEEPQTEPDPYDFEIDDENDPIQRDEDPPDELMGYI